MCLEVDCLPMQQLLQRDASSVCDVENDWHSTSGGEMKSMRGSYIVQPLGDSRTSARNT
jgi:hypothetical protein